MHPHNEAVKIFFIFNTLERQKEHLHIPEILTFLSYFRLNYKQNQMKRSE